jgi:hypothetical protein
MPYEQNRLFVTGYVIDEPNGDRPYFCHSVPHEYLSKASERGGRIYEFTLELPRHGELIWGSGVRELNLTRAKVLADVFRWCETHPSQRSAPPLVTQEILSQMRHQHVRAAAEHCQQIEMLDKLIFASESRKEAVSVVRDERVSDSTIRIPWRGSVSDLATDIHGELSDDQMRTLIEELGRKVGVAFLGVEEETTG